MTAVAGGRDRRADQGHRQHLSPTDLLWFVFTKFRHDRDIAGHFLGHAASTIAEALQSGGHTDDVRDVASLLFIASRDDLDLDSTVTEEIDGDTAIVTVVPNDDPSIRRRVHMRRMGRAWKIWFPAQG